MTSMNQLKQLIAAYKSGDKITIKFERLNDNGYEEQSVKVTLGSQSYHTGNQ